MGTDLHELVDAGQPADRHPISEVHMAPQRGVVRQRGVVVHLAIVRDMAVGHDPVVASDARDATGPLAVSYTHLRAHETVLDLVCRLLLEKQKVTDYDGEYRSPPCKRSRI